MRSGEICSGRVVMIPVYHDMYVVAQVAFPGTSFYLIGFEGLCRIGGDVESIVYKSPIIGAWTNDAEIYKKRWKLDSVYRLHYTDFVKLEYKYISGGVLFRQSFDGTSKDIGRCGDDKLPYKSSFSPIIFGNALCAANGYGEWKSYYEKILLR